MLEEAKKKEAGLAEELDKAKKDYEEQCSKAGETEARLAREKSAGKERDDRMAQMAAEVRLGADYIKVQLEKEKTKGGDVLEEKKALAVACSRLEEDLKTSKEAADRLATELDRATGQLSQLEKERDEAQTAMRHAQDMYSSIQSSVSQRRTAEG